MATPDEKSSEYIIKEGDHAIFSVNNNQKYLYAQIKSTSSIKIMKTYYKLAPVVGQHYGTNWEATKSLGLVLLKKEMIDLDDMSASNEENSSPGLDSRDNRNLVQDNKHQKLTQDEIQTMKQQGLRGEEIIKALVDNSVSFSNKTEFSQKKYLEKKQRKYCPVVKVIRPTALGLCKSYFSKSGVAGQNMAVRPDSLAQILTLSNISAGSFTLVYDETKGNVVTGSIVERIGLEGGKVISLYKDGSPINNNSLRMFNFDQKRLKQTIDFVSLGDLLKVFRKMTSTDTTSSNEGGKTLEPNEERINELSNNLKGLVDCLIIVGKVDIMPLFRLMWPFLKPSRSFVIYNPFMQPLSEAYEEITKTEDVICGQFAETWSRNYQILPFRTRPEMTMSGASGYVFSGIKVMNDDMFEDKKEKKRKRSIS